MYHVLFFHTMWKSLLCMVILSLVWEHMMMGFVEVQNKWGELEMDSFKVLTILSGCKIYKSKTDMILVICLPNLQNIPSYFIQVPWIIHVRCFNLVALQNKCHCRRGNGLFCSQVSSNLLISVLRVSVWWLLPTEPYNEEKCYGQYVFWNSCGAGNIFKFWPQCVGCSSVRSDTIVKPGVTLLIIRGCYLIQISPRLHSVPP